jgi:hypothetical protein
MTPTLGFAWRVGVALLLPLAALVVFYPLRTPSPGAAAFGGFSLDRAWEHVRAITDRGPHPLESVANDRVREYLLAQFSRLGLGTEVQTATVFQRRVHNVLARLPGAAAQRGSAVMLVAHYDSVTRGPGAGDDGAAVAALLETARCLAERPRPQQDVFFLITDGEEAGLLGARAFCGDVNTAYKEDVRARAAGTGDGPPSHPALADVGIVLNFDARGSSGPAIMYETSPGNAGLLGQFAAAAPYPVANSFSYDVYRMLRNDSDFTIFRRAGKAGLNVAFIGDYFNYHTANDTPQRLDGRSMYHDGTYALSLARQFANLDAAEMARVTAPGQPNAVYFTAAPRLLVRYPAAWIWPLTVVQLALGILVLVVARRVGVITVVGVIRAAARFVAAVLFSMGALYKLGAFVDVPDSSAALSRQLAMTVGIIAAITLALALPYRRGRRPTTTDATALALVLVSLLSVPINVWLPGGSFLMVWPGLFLAGALATDVRWPAGDWRRTIAHTVASLPVVFIIVPLMLTLFVALTLDVAPFLAPFGVLVTWLMIGAIGPGIFPISTPDSAEVVGGAHPT